MAHHSWQGACFVEGRVRGYFSCMYGPGEMSLLSKTIPLNLQHVREFDFALAEPLGKVSGPSLDVLPRVVGTSRGT